MKEIIHRLTNHENLDEIESRDILIEISSGKYNNEQIASFLTIFMMRGITAEEIIGFQSALLELCVKMEIFPQSHQ